MEELIIALVAAVAEMLGEALMEVICGFIADIFLRIVRKFHSKLAPFPTAIIVVGYILAGAVFGVVSVLLSPHQITPHTRFHGINLLISPIIVGLVMSYVGVSNRKRERQTVRIESFGYGFVFALGMAIIRFIFVK
jgi:uncharacterized protein YacL